MNAISNRHVNHANANHANLMNPLERPARCRRPALALALRRRMRDDSGMTTSEYAVGTIAACAFAAILYKIVTSDGVVTALTQLITKALDVQF